MAKEKVKDQKGKKKSPVVDEDNLPVMSIDDCEVFDPSFKKADVQDAEDEESFEELDEDIDD